MLEQDGPAKEPGEGHMGYFGLSDVTRRHKSIITHAAFLELAILLHAGLRMADAPTTDRA